VIEETEGFVVGRLDHLCILRTRAPMSVASVDAFYAGVLAMSEEFSEPLVTLVIPGARRPTTSTEVRSRVKAVWPKILERSTATAIWIRQGSFAGAIQRSIASTITLLIRGSAAIKICSSAEAATAFMIARRSTAPATTQDWTPVLDQFATAFDPTGVQP